MKPTRRNLMLGTAGHVDHGKTALVKLLTGCNTDSLAEEQKRGLTIDLGFAPCRLADQRVVGIVDVPGHVDFIRNMVAGAQGIDVVIFVVAADDGIMPQTYEHLHILTLMGVRHGVVALTKTDRVPPDRHASVRKELHRMLSDTFLQQAPICPVSNITGEGYDDFFDALNGVIGQCPDRPVDGRFRMWVEDTFIIRGAGSIVTGIPHQGRVRPGDSLHLLPLGRETRVRRLQVYGEDADEGRAGECVALNLPELETKETRRGQVLSAELPPPVTLAEVELRLLPHLKSPLTDYAETQLHIGTSSVLARVALLEHRALEPGQTGLAQLRWKEPLALAPGERFVLRANLPASGQTGLTTVGGGRVLDLSGVRLRRQRPWTIEHLNRRREAIDDPVRWIEVLLEESPTPLSPEALAARAHREPTSLAPILNRLLQSGRIHALPGHRYLHRQVIDQTTADLLTAIKAHHQEHPDHAGLPRAEWMRSSQLDPAIAQFVLDALLRQHAVQVTGTDTALALPGFQADLSDRQRGLGQQVAELLQAARWTPPAPTTLAEQLGLPPTETDQLLRALIADGTLVRLDPAIILHRDAVDDATEIILRLFREKPSFTTMAFRDALGISRKYAVPLLDHLDHLKWTVRSGNLRTPGRTAQGRLEKGC